MKVNGKLDALRVKKTETMLTILGVPDVPGTAAGLFSALAVAGIPITMIVQNAPGDGFTSITFTVSKQDAERAHEIARERAEQMSAEGTIRDDDIARLSVWGTCLEETAGVAGRVFTIMADNGINVLAINTTADIVSCIIEDSIIDKAVDILCKELGLRLEEVW